MLWDARDKVFDFDYKHLCRQDPDKYICMSIRYPVLFYFHQDSHNNNIDPSCRIHACKAYWADNLRLVLLVIAQQQGRQQVLVSPLNSPSKEID